MLNICFRILWPWIRLNATNLAFRSTFTMTGLKILLSPALPAIFTYFVCLKNSYNRLKIVHTKLACTNYNTKR